MALNNHLLVSTKYLKELRNKNKNLFYFKRKIPLEGFFFLSLYYFSGRLSRSDLIWTRGSRTY